MAIVDEIPTEQPQPIPPRAVGTPRRRGVGPLAVSSATVKEIASRLIARGSAR